MPHMFYSCTKLETLDLSSFATPNMTSMLCAFQYCKNLKKIYVTSAFTTDKVTEGPYAFAGCVNLPNFNPDKTGVEMAHTGEGGYLTAATASWVRWDAPTGTLSFHRGATKPAGDNILDLGYGNIRIGTPMLQKFRRLSSKLVSGMKPTRRAPIGLMVVRILPA